MKNVEVDSKVIQLDENLLKKIIYKYNTLVGHLKNTLKCTYAPILPIQDAVSNIIFY